MKSTNQQRIVTKLINKMTVELMTLTRLPREECLQLLKAQFTPTASRQCVLSNKESQFISALFH